MQTSQHRSCRMVALGSIFSPTHSSYHSAESSVRGRFEIGTQSSARYDTAPRATHRGVLAAEASQVPLQPLHAGLGCSVAPRKVRRPTLKPRDALQLQRWTISNSQGQSGGNMSRR
jgi:hypothetical protein